MPFCSPPVQIDLSGARLGDVLMLLPCLRTGDTIYHHADTSGLQLPARQQPIPAAPHAMHLGFARQYAGHRTEQWAQALDRVPQYHRLVRELTEPRSGMLIVPTVSSPTRQWHGWEALRKRFPRATVISADLPRRDFIKALLRAETVICPNTGTAHLADALGVPKVIGLYNRVLFECCAPFWRRQNCIVAESVNDITVEEVYESAA